MRQVLMISSGSVFHLIDSRACWLTARRSRPHRPSWRHPYSLAGRAVRCKRGGGDTLDKCLWVYCSLGREGSKTQIPVNKECVCAFEWFLRICCMCHIRFLSISHLPGWVLRVCFGWTSPLLSAGWWTGQWGCCSGRGPVLLNGACGG